MTMAAKPSSEDSWCQTYSASYPQSSRSDRTQSWSQFDPGNWITANRGLRRPASLGRDNSSCVGGSARFTGGVELIGDFEAKILNHGVGEEVAAQFLELGLQLQTVARGRIQLDFHHFSGPDHAGAGQAQLVERIADGDALGIQHGGFRHDGDTCFHYSFNIRSAGRHAN